MELKSFVEKAIKDINSGIDSAEVEYLNQAISVNFELSVAQSGDGELYVTKEQSECTPKITFSVSFPSKG